MANKNLTKEELAAKRAARQQKRKGITDILAGLKGKNIKTMTATEKEKLLVVICDFLGISEQGTVL